MKSLAVIAALALGAVAGHWAVADSHDAAAELAKLMQEMATCEICSSAMDHPQLMDTMKWETHKIDQGMLMVATVPQEHLKEFRALTKQWEAAIEKVKKAGMRGDEVKLCSFCGDMGRLMQAGAKQQDVETANGSITLVTAADADVVKAIHALADKSIKLEKEMAQMAQAGTAN